jgi:hypothetical protein
MKTSSTATTVKTTPATVPTAAMLGKRRTGNGNKQNCKS